MQSLRRLWHGAKQRNLPSGAKILVSRVYSNGGAAVYVAKSIFSRGLRLLRQVVDTPPLVKLRRAERIPGPQAQSDDDLLASTRAYAENGDHPVGSLKMGPRHDPLAVVDERLRIHGLHGLRVVDASVMPTIPRGHTNVPTIMIAERAADLIKADNR